MRVRIFLGGLALAVALSTGEEASACIPLAVSYGREPPPTTWERAVAQQQYLRELVRVRRPLARAALAQGVDVPAELANMLVPNIRPVPIERSDCGVENEIDQAQDEETIEDWLAGTYLAGRAEQFADMIGRYQGETLGPACNAEFRERFAAYLRSRLDARQLGRSYVFLAARWSGSGRPLSRLVAFAGRGRRPPVRWYTSYGREIERWMRRNAEGRALRQAVSDFWREDAALLEDPALACPAALARWPAAQALIVAEIEGENPELVAALRRPAR